MVAVGKVVFVWEQYLVKLLHARIVTKYMMGFLTPIFISLAPTRPNFAMICLAKATRAGLFSLKTRNHLRIHTQRSFSLSAWLSATQNDSVFHVPQSVAPKTPSIKPDHLETNAPTETNRLEKTLERFWEKVSVGYSQSSKADSKQDHVVLLDNKPIKTPAGHPLLIPSEKSSLAHLIAHEWTVLPSLKIKPHLVPLTSLASRAVDLTDGTLTKESMDPLVVDNIVEALLPYLDTDTLLVFSPYSDCEGNLRPAQEKEFRPLIAKAEKIWGSTSDSSKSLTLNWLDTETMGFATNKQTAETKEAVGRWIKSLDPWRLVALERATMSAKSLIIGMLIATGDISIPDAVRAATLETVHQIELWGEVQDSHDVDFHDIQRTLASAYILGEDV